MQRLIFLIDGLAILLFLWIIFNVLHAVFHIDNTERNNFLWLSNKIRGIKK